MWDDYQDDDQDQEPECVSCGRESYSCNDHGGQCYSCYDGDQDQ